MYSTAHMQRHTYMHYTHEQINPAMQAKFLQAWLLRINSRTTYYKFINVHHHKQSLTYVQNHFYQD